MISKEQRAEIEKALVSHLPVFVTEKTRKRIKGFLSILKLALDDVTEKENVS